MFDFLLPFATIALSELGDKTQLAIVILSARSKKVTLLLAGILLAFAITTVTAVMAGALLALWIPASVLKWMAGIGFIVFGIWIWFSHEKSENLPELKQPFWTGFTLILLAEMGDKSQLATALFAVKFNPVWVAFSTWLALALLSILAIKLGKALLERIEQVHINQIAALVFVLMGIGFIFL